MKYIPVCAVTVTPLKDVNQPVERILDYLSGAIPATVYDDLLKAISNEGVGLRALTAAMDKAGEKAREALSHCPVCNRSKTTSALACDACIHAAKKEDSPEMKALISLLKELEG